MIREPARFLTRIIRAVDAWCVCMIVIAACLTWGVRFR